MKTSNSLKSFISNFTVVSTYKYTLVTGQYTQAPGWNSYCLGVDIVASTVGLAINGAVVANNINIKAEL